MEKIPKEYRPFGLFSLATINTKCNKIYHEDMRDEYPCVVVPLGEFEGGSLGFSEFNIALDLKVGDFAIFQGRLLYHQAQAYEFFPPPPFPPTFFTLAFFSNLIFVFYSFTGERMSIVFCVKQKTLANARKYILLPTPTPPLLF